MYSLWGAAPDLLQLAAPPATVLPRPHDIVVHGHNARSGAYRHCPCQAGEKLGARAFTAKPLPKKENEGQNPGLTEVLPRVENGGGGGS